MAALLMAGLVACASKAAPAGHATEGVQGTNGSGSLNSPKASSSTDPTGEESAGDGGAGHHDTDGGADGGAAPAAPGPQTCSTLAAAAQKPAGQLQVTAVHSITPIDVYATQDENGLSIVLTQTANECGYRANNLTHQSLGEVQIITPTPESGAFAAGTFQPQEIFTQQGTECLPPGADPSQDQGSSFQDSGAQGTMTITAISATSVTGTMDVQDFRGHAYTFTFTAPICGALTQDQLDNATCCGDPAQ